jgi:hypothetical protein
MCCFEGEIPVPLGQDVWYPTDTGFDQYQVM